MSFNTHFDMYTPDWRILRQVDYRTDDRLMWNNGLMWNTLIPKPDVVGNITEDIQVFSVFEIIPSKLWHSQYGIESAGSVFLNDKRV